MYRIALVVVVSCLLSLLAAAETAPIQLERVGVYPAGRVEAVDAQGSFVAWGFGRELHLGRLRPDGSIAEIGSLLLEDSIGRVSLSGSTAVAATSDGALAFVDLSNPSAPALVHWVGNVAASAPIVVATSDHVFVTRQARISVRDLATGQPPWRSSSWNGDRSVNAIAVDGDLMMACDGSAVHTFDISDPARFEHLAAVPGARNEGPGAIGLRGDLALVACGDGLRTFDVGDPSSPIEIGHLDTTTSVAAVVMLDGFALVATSYRLSTVDLRDPAAPEILPVADIAAYDLAPSLHGVLTIVDSGLDLVTPIAHGEATVVTALDAPATGPIRALDLFADGTLVTLGSAPGGGTLRALRHVGEGRLVEWARASPPVSAGSDLIRASDDLLILGDDRRVVLCSLGDLGFEVESTCCGESWLEPLAAEDRVLWAAGSWVGRRLVAISLADPSQPGVLSSLWVADPDSTFGDPRTSFTLSAFGAGLFGGAVWSSAHRGVLAVWLDWSTREGPFDPRVTAYRHQIRLLDAASPEAPVEVGSYDPGGRFELVARHGDRLVIGALAAAGGTTLRALSIADPSRPVVVAERGVDRLPTDARPFGPWLVGRIRTGDEPVVVIDPETLEMTEVPVVPGSTLGIRHHAVSWPWLALVRDDGAVELYRAFSPPSP